MSKKGHIDGRRIRGKHTTITEDAARVANFALGLPSVKRVGPGAMYRARRASGHQPSLTVKHLNGEVLDVKVTCKGRGQVLTVSTADPEATIRALRVQFPHNFTERKDT